MNDKRVEPFLLALSELRARLRLGDVPLDTRLAATEIASELGLSATPVREALSRLAGEGLLEDRRGEGFFVRRLRRADIAVLYRLCHSHLILAADTWRAEIPSNPVGAALDDFDDPIDLTERLLAQWTSFGGSRLLSLSFARFQAQLGAVRRLEPRLLDRLPEEAAALSASQGDRAKRMALLKTFYNRRVRLAGRLAELLEEGAGRPAL